MAGRILWPFLTRAPVLCQKARRARSSRLSVIVVEQAAKSLTSNDPAIRVLGLQSALDEPIFEALVISLSVVVFDEIRDRPSKMSLAEQNDSIEALTPDRQDESLRQGRILCPLVFDHLSLMLSLPHRDPGSQKLQR
jgi:hypothetical protein